MAAASISYDVLSLQASVLHEQSPHTGVISTIHASVFAIPGALTGLIL